jgi:glycosyltransferase involved in cell wall biosynthesis
MLSADSFINKYLIRYGMAVNQIDLFLLTSLLPDPFPTVVLESMSAGVPTIGYCHGGINEMLHDDPLCLIPIGDYETLAEKIYFFFTHEKDRLEIANKQYNY